MLQALQSTHLWEPYMGFSGTVNSGATQLSASANAVLWNWLQKSTNH